MVKKSRIERVDIDMIKELRDIMKIRATKGLAEFKPSQISFPEATRLLRRTQGYQLSLEELKTKPKQR